MKFTILLLLAGIWIAAVEVRAQDSMSLKDALATMEQFVEECKPPPTKEQMIEILKNKRDASPESKCLRHCLLSQFEMFQEGTTKLHQENAVNMLEMGVPDKKELLMQTIDKCNAKNAAITNECEIAHAHAFCIIDELEANGVKLPQLTED